ncbi:MAG: VWA-like domain-containing protein, partial [Candidatus Methylomirabilales bacterium]
ELDIPGIGVFSPLYEEWAKALCAEEIYDELRKQKSQRPTHCPICGQHHAQSPSGGNGKTETSNPQGQPTPQNGISPNNQPQDNGSGTDPKAPQNGSHKSGQSGGGGSRGPQDPRQGTLPGWGGDGIPGQNAPQSGNGNTGGQPTQGSGSGGPQPNPFHGHCQPGRTCLQLPPNLTDQQAQDIIDAVAGAHDTWINSNQRGSMPAGLNRFLQRLRAAKVPWQRVLHQVAGTALAKDDYSLNPPHRRWLQYDIIRPTLRSETIALLVLVFDTSGSISRPMAEEFAAEGAKLHTLCEETLILTGDCAVQQVIRTQQVPEFLRTLEFKGGGGTSHIPIFTWLTERRLTPDLLVACTDLYSEYPDRKPSFPVLWCTKEGHGAGPPWGRIVIIPERTPSECERPEASPGLKAGGFEW